MSGKIRAVICGASGYTGAELLRILCSHPKVEVVAATSEKSANKPVTDLFPHLSQYSSLTLEPLNIEPLLDKGDVFFMALPHGASQKAVNSLYEHGKRIIDLSADFRLRDPVVYEKWYKEKHGYHTALSSAVYGLPELYRESIKNAKLVANPGCYPTSAILALFPALTQKIVNTADIVIDSKSGVSGAGRKADLALSFCEVNNGFKAYGVSTHRHTPEIEQELSVIAGTDIKVSFTPHLIPVNRGMLSTVYAKLKTDIAIDDVSAIYNDAYKNEPFVKVLPKGMFPDTRYVSGTNYCHIGLSINHNKTLIVVSAIDNLIKGASGQAVQNMNLMFGYDETTALESLSPVVP
ncbi:N-acetyl-gamma-glutamyl-phosphate reductase [Candidatus Magnetomonas plexicatena]|uniref:N-acetyl-gamma-glutamyl-phosphate reductase n=1 Tax=Candidatus Magnetomonas plexicatena TaxID=2552947 RepID=UPI001C756E7F|nr:N-acetyl-gamma-glutamyl-phosphate reductase [Nitrospirales bacterium LBB_01]